MSRPDFIKHWTELEKPDAEGTEQSVALPISGSVAVDPLLRIPNEPRKIQFFPFAGLYGQALIRGTGRGVRTLRRGRWPAAIVHIGLPGRIVRAGGNRRARDRGKDGSYG